MKLRHTPYVDFQKFGFSMQNNDLMASPSWQRNVQLLVASLCPSYSRRVPALKTKKRP